MIDLRSDTFTKPSQAMRKAMADAEVGDDVSREDPTIIRLEERAAHLMSKEAALFVPSGTFGNQLALFTLADRGQECYLSEHSHIIQHECGAASIISGVMLRSISPALPWLTWEELQARIRTEEDIHFPKPGLVALENALGSGQVQPLEEMEKIAQGCGQLDLPIHMDGARVFNAALALGVEPGEITAHVDTVMFCLSKGLGAPVGSLLCGPRPVIEEARVKRKIMGGGMRQVGVLGAAGLVALDEGPALLKIDHERSRALAELLHGLPAFHCDPADSQINLVFTTLVKNNPENRGLFLKLLKERGIITYPPEYGVFRFVFHRDISDGDFSQIEKVFQEINDLLL